MVQLQDQPVASVATDVVVEPAHVAWWRRLDDGLTHTMDELATAVVDLLVEELRADHVALWCQEDREYAVLASSGLSAGAQRMRLPDDYPVVNVARGLGGTLRRDQDNHAGPRAPGLPGSSSRAYAMMLLDDAGPVALFTASGRELGEGAVSEVRHFLEALDWPAAQG